MYNKLFQHARERSDVWIFSTMLVGAALSLLAAFVLSVDSLEIAKNPNAVLSCSLNAVINCASVMKHPSAEMFGFPNSYIGLMAEPVVITIAIAGLAGVRFPRAFMAVAQAFYGLGLIFAFYLFSVSAFQIGALCPWCLLVTLSTTLVFMSMLHYNIREDNLYVSERHNVYLKKWIASGYDRLLTASIIAVLIFIILFKYHDGLFG
ncbi:MAG TPA: vitamin K epoxide reductase family protein [Candidatus Chromulinivoraceae bacterium]|nr:vitamin K epoxide reductase family protein [Candidatus Chromulinivoraceae bacterium]